MAPLFSALLVCCTGNALGARHRFELLTDVKMLPGLIAGKPWLTERNRGSTKTEITAERNREKEGRYRRYDGLITAFCRKTVKHKHRTFLHAQCSAALVGRFPCCSVFHRVGVDSQRVSSTLSQPRHTHRHFCSTWRGHITWAHSQCEGPLPHYRVPINNDRLVAGPGGGD